MSSKSSKLIFGAAADPNIVRGLTMHLLDAYEKFLNGFDGDVDYVDSFMAVHNFHVRSIEHLVEESGSDIWRNAAVTTFERRMKVPGDYDTK